VAGNLTAPTGTRFERAANGSRRLAVAHCGRNVPYHIARRERIKVR
jgi:hypothetical protein